MVNRTALYQYEIPWDFTGAASVDGFTITGVQPTGTDRRAVFKVGNDYYALTVSNGVGTPAAVSVLTDDALDVDKVLTEGNTMAELAEVTSIPAWVGEEVYAAFALSMDEEEVQANAPTLKISAKHTIDTEQDTLNEISGEIYLSDMPVRIIDTAVESSATTGNSVTVYASLLNNGEWGEYQPIADTVNQYAQKLKIKAVYTVAEIGVGNATLSKVSIKHLSNDSKISTTVATIVTNTKDLGMTANYIRASLAHDKLEDAEIKAYVALRDTPLEREMYQLGVATGSLQTLSLTDEQIDPTSIKMWIGTKRYYKYDYNLETSEVTVTGEAGQGVYISYRYGAGVEEWLPMQAVGTQVYELDTSRYNSSFSYAVPGGEGKGIAAVKFEMIRHPGTTTEVLGVGNGLQQMFALKHSPKSETMQIPGATSFVVQDRNVILVAPAGTNLVATYDYNGVPPVAYSYVIAWND